MAFGWGEVYSLALFASAVAAILIGFAYAFGQLLQNPRFNVWAKTEIFQVAVSIVLVFLCLFMVGLIGLDPDSEMYITAGWINAFASGDPFGISSTYNYVDYEEIQDSDSVFETSEKFLKNMAYFSHRSVRAARAMMGAADEFSKYTRTPCVPSWLMCLMGVNGVNVRPLSGAASLMQSSNLLLYTSTAAYLTVLAQIFFLKFIQSGPLSAYLALAIVLRSLPFMRTFGGGLIAICISLFLLFPMLLFVESAFWDPYNWVGSETWNNVGEFADEVEMVHRATTYGDLYASWGGGEWHFSESKSTLNVTEDVVSVTSAAFLSSTFLFTFNIIAVSASAALFARLLGAEVDLSRLAQIV